MRSGQEEMAILLRWYPPRWRERYGEELMALMEDDLGGQRPTRKFKLSVMWGGLRERGHQIGLVGEQAAPEQARAGSLLILCAWSAFVLAGASFSKTAEHFARAVPIASRALPQGAFNAVAGLGVVGVVLVAFGAIVALPAFVRFLRAGGWSVIRGHVLRAAALTVVTVTAVIPLSAWAHGLNEPQRNGGDAMYSAGFVLWALLVAGALAGWTAAGVAAARRIELGIRVIRIEAVLAVAVACILVAITAATAVWWGAMAKDAPWFLGNTQHGTTSSPYSLQLSLTMALMLAAALFAGYGVLRISRSWTEFRTP
jgi:hypothetical protein